MKKKISIITPVFNEEANILNFHRELKKSLPFDKYEFEIIFINDGSGDKSGQILDELTSDGWVKAVHFTRNFGKEAATSAGIHLATGDACVLIDCDLQHPPKLISKFIERWEEGALVVVGVRNNHSGETLVKKIGSKAFYKIINQISETKLTPNSTDFRLLDRMAIEEFKKFSERNRISRGLIDWLGFDQEYIYFDSPKRDGGEAGYSTAKLIKLAFNSIVALSIFPLKLAGYLGLLITFFSAVLGVVIFISKYILKNTWGTSITSTGLLALMILFLIGIVLACLGLIALYIANIHQESIGRPLYVIRRVKGE